MSTQYTPVADVILTATAAIDRLPVGVAR
jgi:hypothetical protein